MIGTKQCYEAVCEVSILLLDAACGVVFEYPGPLTYASFLMQSRTNWPESAKVGTARLYRPFFLASHASHQVPSHVSLLATRGVFLERACSVSSLFLASLDTHIYLPFQIFCNHLHLVPVLLGI